MKKISTVQAFSNEIFKEQKLTIGLDLGDRWSFYCVLDEAGKILLEQKVATTPEAMKQTFGKIPRSLIAMETGTHSPWVSRLLTELGHEVIVAHAQKVELITKSNRKDDRPIVVFRVCQGRLYCSQEFRENPPMATWKLCTLQVGIPVLAALFSSSLFGQEPSSTKRTPEGWYVYPNSKLKNADESTLRCFNYSHNEWQVKSEGEGVRIAERTGKKTDVPSLPPLLEHQPWMPGRTVNAGLRSATNYGHGWLLAYDAGEFGGGLWLTNENGSETKRILSDNIRAVVPIDSGILVLSGLAHMSMDFGNAFIFSIPDGLDISLQHSVHLDGAPSAYAKEADGSVLFVTTYGLDKITKSGELQRLTYFPRWTRMQYPNSMVVATDGTIFIGMRMFVLRLSANSTGYNQDWLLPNSCRKFEIRQLDCVCKP